MPKINRVRIANIQYDKKIIKDLILNCYSGENVLLNLANGGGKSVLVQLLQQPLLPESKIHNREVYSYLSPEQPSYIFIEWKLDNSPNDYLLTGIVMNRLFSSEDMNRTKYFTFVNQYRTVNEFDIKNIPFIQKQESAIVYKSYETALKMINESRNNPELRSFGRSEQSEYRKKLSEYGIFTNEWKTLSKINENEGGVDELFKDCKTSDSLVNKWILKTISDSNEAESKELKDMFISLIQEIIDKESNIKEKEILEDFKVKIEEYEHTLKLLLEQLEQERQVEDDIYNIYLSLQELSKENQEKIEQIAQKMIENQKEIEHIKYEEVSEEYYHYQSDLEAIKQENEKVAQELKTQKVNVENATFQYRIQKVAYINQKEKEANAKMEALRVTRDNLENQNNKDEYLLKVEYSLQEEYKQKIEDFCKELEKIEKENNLIKGNIGKWKDTMSGNHRNITDFSRQVGTLQEKINQFETEEKRLFERMQIFIARNLLNELEQKEVERIKEKIQNEIQQIQNELEENQKRIGIIVQQIKQDSQKEEENNINLEKLNKIYTEKTMEYQEFQQQVEKIKEILNFHRIKEDIFEKQLYLTIITEKQAEYKRKIEDIVSQIDRTKETILDLEQGGLHNSREIRKMLENANIEYITGEEYLKKQDEKYQNELLDKNPLLPYCYIVTQEDLAKIKQLEIREEVNKLAPIITYQNIDKTVQKEKQMIQIDEIYFLSLYHKQCFSINANEYQQKLEMQLENYKKRKNECETELQKIEEHIRIIELFYYKEKDKKEMEQELVYFERQIQNKKEENNNIREKRKNLQDEIDKRKQEIEENKTIRNNKNQEQEEFLQYLEKNTKYCENIKQKEDCEKQILLKKQESENIEKQIETSVNKEKENLTKKNEISKSLEKIKEKQIKIPKRENQEKLNISIEELEAQYEQLTQKYEQDIKSIDEQITFLKKTKEDLVKERLKDYGDIKEEDYALVIYSEEMEDLAKDKKEVEEKELGYKTEELRKVSIKLATKKTQFQTICNSLKKMEKTEPISASQINGNYEARRNKIEQEKEEGKRKETEYTEQNKIMQRQINDVERSVDIKAITEQRLKAQVLENNNQIGDIKDNKKEVEKADLQELIKKYKIMKQKNQVGKDRIYKNQVEISTNYKERHRIISSFLENVSLQNTEQETFESYYYIYEKMVDCLEKLREYIGILDLSLQNIEKDKRNILKHAITQGNMLYQEMKRISDSSRIKVGDRYVQILKIEIPQELKDYSEQRIENHIQQCIQDLREECKKCEDVKRTIESKVAVYLSDRQLLNLTLDVETIKVKLYKFDIENKNSGLRQWEDVIVGNSGGQKFIACFALISALIEYTRRKELENLGEDDKLESSKVFILDNPFGKTSSKHLLEPLIEISKKFNIQMICLSDLSQSSITDKFALIYQLALRSSKYSNNSFLNVEDFRANTEVVVDTSLEQVYLRNSSEQISFLS